MFRAARLVSRAVRAVFAEQGPVMKAQDTPFILSLLLGGQLAGRELRLFQIYSAGNFIQATTDTPYLQIGEHKYGKPILDRIVRPDTPLADGEKAVLLSMDSTLRSNLSVGMPLDLCVLRRDECNVTRQRRIDAGDPAFRTMSEAWSSALRDGFTQIKLAE